MITQGPTIMVIYGGDSIYSKSLSGYSMEELSVLVAKLSQYTSSSSKLSETGEAWICVF
jgi:hypothetical protein